MPSDTIQQRADVYAETIVESGETRDAIRDAHAAGAKAQLDAVLAAIPSNWLDPMLTGPDCDLGRPPYNCKDVEFLFIALRTRLEALR